MATLDKAEALLEELRAASWDAAVRDLAEVEVSLSICQENKTWSWTVLLRIASSAGSVGLARSSACAALNVSVSCMRRHPGGNSGIATMDVQAFAREHGFDGELRQWDVSFWAERLREERYAITDEQLRPYFALPAVLDGLFAVRTLLVVN